jgi:hypothetical protein
MDTRKRCENIKHTFLTTIGNTQSVGAEDGYSRVHEVWCLGGSGGGEGGERREGQTNINRDAVDAEFKLRSPFKDHV